MEIDMTASSPVGFLTTADETAQKAWAASVKASVVDPLEAELLFGALKHPFLRHLMELYLNDSVTYFGASVLFRCGFADVGEYKARQDWCRGHDYGVIDLNAKGRSFFESLQDRCSEKPWFETLADGITDYACRDAGDGICLGREHLASAIENYDTDVLNRVLEPFSIDHAFWKLDPTGIFTDDARLATEEFWSPNFQGRRSAKIVVPGFEYERPSWTGYDADYLTPLFNEHAMSECMKSEYGDIDS